jgi:Rad3-related DNA helicase
MEEQYLRQPGNYLAFFSSYEYLAQVATHLHETFPAIPLWRQARAMDEQERQDFLGRFQLGGRGIGFAVLGGAFGEGIDLPGDRLIGAFIATLGQPQVNSINEQFRQQLDKIVGRDRGYDYTYFYPGIQKIVQAAGRVVRTVVDEGSVFLIDERFAQRRVQNLFPAWWQIGATIDQ